MKNLLLILLFPLYAFGQQQTINIGASPNDGTGDPLRTAMQKVNANFTELYDNVLVAGTASGTDTYAVAPDPAWTSYVSGRKVLVTFTNENTSTTVTLNVSSLGARAVKDNEGNDLAIGDIVAGGSYMLRDNGTHLRVVGATGSGGGGGGSLSDGDYGDVTVSGTGTVITIDNTTVTAAKLATLSSSDLAGKLTDESGTGLVAYTTSPTFTTPALGTPSSGTLTNTTAAVEAYDATGWNGDDSPAAKNDIRDKIETLVLSSNTPGALTDGAAITITGTKHTLTTDEGGITFTISYTGDKVKMKVIFNTTSATWTFPAGALCVVDGVATGTNTAPVDGVSGDTFIVDIEDWGSGVYSVVIKNILQ